MSFPLVSISSEQTVFVSQPAKSTAACLTVGATIASDGIAVRLDINGVKILESAEIVANGSIQIIGIDIKDLEFLNQSDFWRNNSLKSIIS